ncbi:YtxH domain-containing protein [Nafulsella turpanensis]|uniref:YtxH domain-containing protein n=1 Tax=Nafulsella turpanensis TaxID=1265690 RepID=UPI000345F145|nr:YtxH domain-containing protein [Nafulsella turpanensis]
MNKGTVGFLSLITGAAVGLAVGVLFAPDTGSNTRGRVSYNLFRFKAALEDLLNELQAEDLPDSAAKSEGERVISDAKIKAEELLKDVETLIGQIKKEEKL